MLEFPTKRSAFIGNSIGQTLPFVRGLLWSCLYICLSVRLSICFCFCFVLFVCLFVCLFGTYLRGYPTSTACLRHVDVGLQSWEMLIVVLSRVCPFFCLNLIFFIYSFFFIVAPWMAFSSRLGEVS